MISHKGVFHIALFIITSIIVSCYAHKHNSCPTEHLKLNYSGKSYEIVWKAKSKANYSIVLSSPPCLDQQGNLVVRVCANGIWISNKNLACHTIETNTLCPDHFIQEGKICIYITQPQPWEEQCPYHGALWAFKNNYQITWLPVKRKIQYGSFEYTLPGEKYGLEFSDQQSSESFEDYSDSSTNCVIQGLTTTEFTSCNATYPHVCSYRYNSFLYRCPDNCVPGGLGSDYCFCKVLNPAPTRCEEVAIPKYSYERDILFKLAGNDVCLVKDLQENSSFSSILIEESLHLAIHKNDWTLIKSDESNCIICKAEIILHPKVDLKLKFNSNSHKLYLDVYSPEGLLSVDDDDAIYCFTDATDKLKTRVEIDEIWDSHSDSHLGRRLKVFKVSIAEHGPGNYWCEAFQLPQVALIKSNVIVAHKKFKGNEYSLRLLIRHFCTFLPVECKTPSVVVINIITKILFRGVFFSRFIKKVRLFHIYNIDMNNETLDILLHLTTETKLPLLAEYAAMYGNLKRLRNTSVIFFRNSLSCLPESTISVNTTLHWKSSTLGKINTPVEICIQETGVPVRRQCQGDFLVGSQWEAVNGNCSRNIKLSSKTELLHSLHTSNEPENLPKSISDITQNSTDLTVLDLHYVAEVLAKISLFNQNNSEELVSELIQIVDNLMTANTTILKKSQLLLNSTDEILDNFESKLLSVNINKDIFVLKMKNLIVQVSKPFQNNISGLALYGKKDWPFLDFQIQNLYTNTSLNYLTNESNLEVAVFVPESLLNVISENISLSDQSNFIIITTVYYKDKFFNSDINGNETVESKVVGVSIPGYGEFLQAPIPVIFRLLKNNKKRRKQICSFWNYGTASETGSGYWSTLGGDYLGSLQNSSLEICSFSHLTNFALLIRDEDSLRGGNISTSYDITTDDYHNDVLTVISDIGCTLSILGIMGIFLTGIVFHSWRDKVGTRILIQLCVAILLQITFLNIATFRDPENPPSQGFCKTIGILLHYVTISEFSWMLVAAVLQFFRFVKVIGPMPNRIIWKAMLVGWGLPLIPVVLVCAINSESYSLRSKGICYPKGLGMYIGVLLPIALIVSANLIVFIAVIRNVFVLRIESHGNSQTILKRQICLAVLLFFLLGLPWGFGLLSEIIHHESVLSYAFIYLFCLTATLQGFILFVFYVLLDKATRTLWYILFKNVFNYNFCRF